MRKFRITLYFNAWCCCCCCVLHLFLSRTLFENYRKSLIQHCEPSELGLQLERWHFFWKSEACGQTVLPDRSLLIGQKLVENAPKCQKIKCDTLSNFQTMWIISQIAWLCLESPLVCAGVPSLFVGFALRVLLVAQQLRKSSGKQWLRLKKYSLC